MTVKYVRIENLFDVEGRANYQGMDITQMVRGSQHVKDGATVFAFEGEIPEGIAEINEGEYLATVEAWKPENPMDTMAAQIDALTLEILVLKGLM